MATNPVTRQQNMEHDNKTCNTLTNKTLNPSRKRETRQHNMKHGNKTRNMEIKHETLQQNTKHATESITRQQNM